MFANLTKGELRAHSISIKSDLAALEVGFTSKKELEHCGMESADVYQGRLNDTVKYAKETYHLDIEASIAGVEGFADVLRKSVGFVKDLLKSKPNPQDRSKIKRAAANALSVGKEYVDPKFLDEAEFVTKDVVLGIPNFARGAKTVDDLIAMLDKLGTEALALSNKGLKVGEVRLKAALDLFNKISKGPKDKKKETFMEGAKTLPEIPDGKDVKSFAEKYLTNVHRNYSNTPVPTTSIKIPALNKEGVKKVAEAMKRFGEVVFAVENNAMELAMDAMAYDDLYDADERDDDEFWSDLLSSSTPESKKLSSALIWDSVIDDLNSVGIVTEKVGLKLLQELEFAILRSIK